MLYTEDHHRLMHSVRRFVAEEIDPHVDAWEEAERFPSREVFRKAGALGLLGITKPVAYGGSGLDFSFAVAAGEALGTMKAQGVGMALSVQSDMATPALAEFGSDALRREYLAPAIAGEVVVSIGVSEEGAGSDVASIRTVARPDGDDYVVSGGKMWITNGMEADWVCLLANTSDGPPHRNKSLIVLPLRERPGGPDRAGVSRRKIRKLGMWCSDTAQLFLDGVRVPKRNRIGEEGRGFAYQMRQFQEERLNAAARRLAMGQMIEHVADYLRARHAFGRPLLDNQVIQFKLAELKTEIEALRALVYHTTERYVAGEDVTELASMCKLKAGRLSREVADWCVQFMGGMGYAWENWISRAWRDFRLGSIGGGADEIMLSIIARRMGLDGRGR
ncbi:acyl-CoA dehydrogenase family protein [Crenalkalicoccus roseus]|uniref:acyl-CoA dehydrogenase family protein n=1 Tax=Crenalkalicoccus roseus TaxID=1485588 RepID=UPI0010810949|nr:acyl-CoA dehydrogenase family protein [Crenalkalicoccus roseus]